MGRPRSLGAGLGGGQGPGPEVARLLHRRRVPTSAGARCRGPPTGDALRKLWASLRGAPPATPAWSLTDPASRRRAGLHYHLADHAILRRRWTNAAELAPGVWRSNHPTHARLAALQARGVRTILNLRGPGESPPFLFERESCEALGLTLVSVRLAARKAPRRDELLKLFDAFREVERPMVMHCKSGADRAGFASALYLLAEGAPLEVARRQLSWRFLHIRHSATGILDHVLDLYGARLARGPIGIEDWVRDDYDQAAADAGFRRW